MDALLQETNKKLNEYFKVSNSSNTGLAKLCIRFIVDQKKSCKDFIQSLYHECFCFFSDLCIVVIQVF